MPKNIISTKSLRPNPLERVTQGRPVIDTNHAQIHASNAFSLSGSLQVAAGDTGAILITVPAAAYVHFQALSFNANGGPATVKLIEDATMDGTALAAATALTPVNHHRINVVASALTVKRHADVTPSNGSGVLTLGELYLPGSSVGQTRVSAQSGNSEEWILKTAKNYLVTFANADDAAVTFGYALFWYEELGA